MTRFRPAAPGNIATSTPAVLAPYQPGASSTRPPCTDWIASMSAASKARLPCGAVGYSAALGSLRCAGCGARKWPSSCSVTAMKSTAPAGVGLCVENISAGW
jgi:hypothetical protein